MRDSLNLRSRHIPEKRLDRFHVFGEFDINPSEKLMTELISALTSRKKHGGKARRYIDVSVRTVREEKKKDAGWIS